MIRFAVLGPLEVWHDGERVAVPAGRARVLLATLLLRANQPVSADELVDRLWEVGAPNPDRAKATLHMVVRRLRQALGEANVVRTTTTGYAAEVPPDALDLHRYRALAERGRHAEALALWRGEPLADVPSDALHRDEVAPLLEHRLDVLEHRIDADLAAGRARALVEELRALTRRHPLREKFWGQLMLALHRSERQADALAVYEEVRGHLAEELGIDPGPALRDLHRQVLENGADGPPRAGVPRQLPVPPRVFVGRRRALRDLDDARSDPTVVISSIDGAAGIGKTALAVHWAHRVAPDFPDGQLYVNLRGYDPSGQPTPPTDVLRGFLEALDVPPERIPPTAEAQASLYRSLLADRKVLVVLDNARDADQVRPLLPGTSNCLVLVTSRNRMTGLVVQEGARPVRLDLFGRDEAVALLEAGVGSIRS
ncbi:transcriptional regulator [Actinosynnema sp. NPDC023658]|uniref:AfsR/SARP family transcriptional regulator n=1 Tax=Actinosynnema sp. NPDC023658 TaxID=3155465 RepID=UPI00340F99FA